jgi:hypothetical protein
MRMALEPTMPVKRLYVFVLFGLLLALIPGPSSQAHKAGAFALAVLAFVDVNGDGAYGLYQGDMEPVIAGVDIHLYGDLPPVRSWGPEDVWLGTATTNQDGYVVFYNVPAGDYALIGTLMDGYLPTTPLEQYTRLEGDGGGAVLEFSFGQLQRSEFKFRWILSLIGVP